MGIESLLEPAIWGTLALHWLSFSALVVAGRVNIENASVALKYEMACANLTITIIFP